MSPTMTRFRRIVPVIAVLAGVAVAFAQNPPPADAPKDKPTLEARTAQPGPVPDRIILTWKGDPTTTQAVTWRTDTTVTAAVAQIAEADAGPGVEPGWRDYDPKKVTTVP